MIDLHHEEVEKFFRSYLEEKFTAKDYKLLKGVFCDEDLKDNEMDLINLEEEQAGDDIDPNNSKAPDIGFQINNVM